MATVGRVVYPLEPRISPRHRVAELRSDNGCVDGTPLGKSKKRQSLVVVELAAHDRSSVGFSGVGETDPGYARSPVGSDPPITRRNHGTTRNGVVPG